MPRYASGSPVRVTGEVRSLPVPPAVVGDPVNAGSILLRVKKPDGTAIADYTTPVNDSTGKYHQDIPASDLTMLGHYPYVWVTTGAGAGVSPPNGFEVIDPFEPELLSLQDAKAYLGETGTQQDDEIRAYAQVASEVVESIVGACTPRTVVESVYAHHERLALSTRPVISVTSATLSGSLVSTTAWTVPYPTSGKVELGTETTSGQLYAVTYLAGRAVIPDRFTHAAREMLRHLWTTQRGQTVDSPLPDFVGDDQFSETAPFGAPFSIPNRVRELLARVEIPTSHE